MDDDLHHALAVDRARRVEPQKIRVWLQSLVTWNIGSSEIRNGSGINMDE